MGAVAVAWPPGVGARVAGSARVGNTVPDAEVGRAPGVPKVGWRAAVGNGVRATGAVGVVSTLRGLSGVGLARGATGAIAGGTWAGMLRGAAGGSAIWGAENGVVAGTGVGGSTVGDGTAVGVSVGTAAIAVGAEAVGAALGKGTAARAADSSATRCTTIVLPSPSR